MTTKIKRKSAKKGNIFSNNKILSSLLIGAGAGVLIALVSKTEKYDELKDFIVDKSKKVMDEFPAFAKAKESSFENSSVN